MRPKELRARVGFLDRGSIATGSIGCIRASSCSGRGFSGGGSQPLTTG